MGKTKFTKEQTDAITLRGKNLLVSASAGTGKTTVLVERIIRMATDPVNPVDLDRMLIVTFTNAASEEMKSRIRDALFEELKKNPGNQRLRRQLILLGQANISTIHSFCSEVIRSNYHLLDIDPGFSVCDEGTADGYLEKAMSNVLASAYADGDDAFIQLTDGYGLGKDDARLAALLSDLYKKARSMPGYWEWLENNMGTFGETYDNFGESPWGRLIISTVGNSAEGFIQDIGNLMTLIEDDELLAGYYDTLEKDLSIYERISAKLKSGKWDECREAVLHEGLPRLANAKKGADILMKDIIKETRSVYKKALTGFCGWFSGTSAQIADNFTQLSPIMKRMAGIILELDLEYRNIKNSEGAVDYSDLEHYALECLEGDAGALYQSRFDEIFVDEYQDSNHIQETIVNLVSGRGCDMKNVFMVGDVKQSIYRFRMADPGIFAKKYNSYSTEISEDRVRIELSDNYRSRGPVLDFTNHVFGSIMSKEAGDIDYAGKVLLNPGYEFPEGNGGGYPVEVKLVCGDDRELFTSDISKDTKEAAVVGGEILRLIETGMNITDKHTKKERPVGFEDIAILIRNANSVSADYVRQLKKMGIPVYSESSSDFFAEREIMIMEAFCRVIDNPRQDIPLAALMRSPIFNFSDMELAYIRCNSRFADYYDSLLDFDEEDELKAKIGNFLETIERYRNDAVSIPIDKLIWDMMHGTGFYHYCEAGGNPTVIQGNLRRLFELAGAYENGRETGLAGFIEYLDLLKKKGIKDASSGGEPDMVTLMSIHKSKGLEFPVVFVSACGKRFNKREYGENILFDRELGFGPEYINAREGYRLTTAVKKSIKIKKETEDLAEEMRVLYVALTRAREKLVITGYVKDLEKSVGKWYLKGLGKNDKGKMSPGKVLASNGYFEWIMPVLTDDSIKNEIENGKRNLTSGSGGLQPFFNLDVFDAPEIRKLLDSRRRAQTASGADASGLPYSQIKERFSWEYPYAHEGIFHKKVSVTELKKLNDVQPGEKDIFPKEFIPKPEFMTEGGPGAAERGTMLHNIIAAAEHDRVFEPGYIESLCEKAGCENAGKDEFSVMIRGFFESELGESLLKYGGESEKPFLLPMPTSDVYPEAANLAGKEHTTVIQGVIDCMIYEPDGIVIVDFKSDNVRPGNRREHAMRYKVQLDLYARAVAVLTKMPVTGKYIYFLKTGETVKIT